jgi:O-antigen ligase
MTVRIPAPSVGLLLVVLALALWVGRGVFVGPIYLQSVQVAGALLTLALLVWIARTRSLPARHLGGRSRAMLAALLVSLVGVAAAALLSAGEAEDIGAAVRFTVRYALGGALLLALGTFLTSRARIARFESALLAAAVASVALAATGFFVPAVAEWTIRSGDRAQGLLNHPNQMAIMLATFSPVALAAAMRRPRRVWPWLTVVALVAGTALTGSKANLLILAGALPVAAILAAQTRRNALGRVTAGAGLLAAAALVAVAAVAIVRTFNPRTLATLERLFSDPTGTSTVSLRLDMWSTAIARGLERPWFGVGAENARHYLIESHAHNVFLEFFLTLGLTGLVALGALVLSVAWIAIASLWTALANRGLPSDDRLALIAYGLACLVYVGANQTSDSFGGTTLPTLWIVSALALAQLDIAAKEAVRHVRHDA